MKETESVEKVLTMHPKDKRGVKIARDRYEVMRKAILQALKDPSEKTHLELLAATRKLLPRDFNGSSMWYFETVKFDLEARSLIMRDTDTEPNRFRLAARNLCTHRIRGSNAHQETHRQH